MRFRHAPSSLVERLDVLLREHLEDELVAQPAGRVAGAGLALAEHGELDAGDVQQLGEGAGDLLGPVLERAGAADPEQVVDLVRSSTPSTERGTSKSSPWVQSRRALASMPHGLPLFSRFFSIAPASRRERRLDQHLEAAHVDDVVDVLDVDRALLDAGAAGGARPQHVGVDDAALLGGADQRPVRTWAALEPVIRPIARLGHAVVLVRRPRSRPRSPAPVLGRASFSPRMYGALANRWSRRSMITSLGDSGLPVFQAGHWLLAATALGAGREVEHALPGEVLDLAAAEDGVLVVGVLEVDRLAAGPSSAAAGRAPSGSPLGAAR